MGRDLLNKMHSAGIYLFKVRDRNTKTMVRNQFVINKNNTKCICC